MVRREEMRIYAPTAIRGRDVGSSLMMNTTEYAINPTKAVTAMPRIVRRQLAAVCGSYNSTINNNQASGKR